MAGSNREQEGDGAERHGDARYESFLVRTWRRDDPARFARVELRHIQTEHVAYATDVDLDWLASTLIRLIGGPHEPPPQ
jgi:hypothetical protein